MSFIKCDRCHAEGVAAMRATSDAKWKVGGQSKMGWWPLIKVSCQLCHSPYSICNPCFTLHFECICNVCERDKQIDICLT